MRVGNSVDELTTVEPICSEFLRAQSATCRAFNFCKCTQFIIGNKIQQNRITQPCRRNKTNRAILRYSLDESSNVQGLRVQRAMRRRDVERPTSWVSLPRSLRRLDFDFQRAVPYCVSEPIGWPSHPRKADADP